MPPLKSLEDSVREAVEKHARLYGHVLVTESDASGSYSFTGLPDGAWHVRAYKEGTVIEKGSRTSGRPSKVNDRDGNPVDISAVVV